MEGHDEHHQGTVAAEAEKIKHYGFDYTKGIFWQMLNAKWNLDEYRNYLDQPKTFVTPWRGFRLFDNPIMELVTQGPWWMTPITFLPVANYFLFVVNQLTILQTLPLFFAGWFMWSFTEYALHRWAFHGEIYWLPDHPIPIALHFLVNGQHHGFPQDASRLTFPVLPCMGILYTVGYYPYSRLLPD
mmetsp:Transcript_32950/g.50392  ORF Transcript_32950/g.50392 Transcript_32950/m.50392 type:complete len:186 (-) Transcript_32950:264-821(-)